MSGLKFGVSGSAAQRRGINRTKMVFASNPFSLSVPEPAFESWLRDSGCLEILDQRTSDLHRLVRSSGSTAKPSNPDAAGDSDPRAASYILDGLVNLLSRLGSRVLILLSLLTFSPFSKLTARDFSAGTPSWTRAFFGSLESYSFPASSSQARIRVQENVKRFCCNYATLFALFFACALYEMPISLFGLVSSLALWEAFKFSNDRWGLDKYPAIKPTLMLLVQCVTAVVLLISNLQFAVFCALCVSYAVTILHSSFRKLTPLKQSATRDVSRTGTRG